MADKYTSTNLPLWIIGFGHYDGINYSNIVDVGYNFTLSSFFPVYPSLILLLNNLFHHSLFSGLIISNFCFYLLLKLLLKNQPKLKLNSWFILFFLTYPTSFFLHSAYTESLFLLLFYLLLLTYRSSLFYLLPLTRVTGLFSVFFSKTKTQLILSLGGLTSYCLYLYIRFKDPLAFIHNLKIFGEQRSGTMVLLPQVYYRYLKILFTSSFNHQYLVALIEISLFSLALLFSLLELKKFYKDKLNFRFRLALFSIASLFLPTLTGSFSSTPRYALLAISQFYYLANLKNKYLKIAFILLFIIMHIYMFTSFFRGYFVS